MVLGLRSSERVKEREKERIRESTQIGLDMFFKREIRVQSNAEVLHSFI